jgi:hypothetical protein
MVKPEFNGSELWNAVHEAVQSTLAPMDPLLLAEFPDLRVTGGSSTGKAFTLFSYRSYAAGDLEPVVVGVLFRPDGHGFLAGGDVSGESSGEVLHEISPVTVRSNPTDIVQAAQRIAADLSAAIDPVREALLNPSRTV